MDITPYTPSNLPVYALRREMPSGSAGAVGGRLHSAAVDAAVRRHAPPSAVRGAGISPDVPDMPVASTNRPRSPVATRLEFIVSHKAHDVVVRLVDAGTGEVVRQYSTRGMSAYAASDDLAPGRLLHEVV